MEKIKNEQTFLTAPLLELIPADNIVVLEKLVAHAEVEVLGWRFMNVVAAHDSHTVVEMGRLLEADRDEEDVELVGVHEATNGARPDLAEMRESRLLIDILLKSSRT